MRVATGLSFPNSSRYVCTHPVGSWSPTDLAGLELWLAGDLGITTVADPPLVDGDMEAAGTAAWSAVGASLSKQAGSPGGSGTQVLRVSNAPAAGYAYQPILTSGNYYRVTGWARGDGALGRPSVWIGNATFSWQGTSSTSWQAFDAVGTTSGGAPNRLCLYSDWGAGYVEFDDITITSLSISAWADQSGKNKHATQATATKQPTYDSPSIGGTGLNSLPVVNWDGTDCLLTPAIDLTGTAQVCLAMVLKSTALSTMIPFESSSNTGANDAVEAFLNYPAGTPLVGAGCNGSGGGFSYVRSTAAFSTATPKGLMWLWDTTEPTSLLENIIQEIGGAPIPTTNLGGPTAGVFGNFACNIGSRSNASSYQLFGLIAEIILLSRLPTPGEITQIETYLATKWNL